MSVLPCHPLPDTASPITDSHGESRWSGVTLIGFLMLCAVLPYANTLMNGFVYDDNMQVMNNPYVRNLHHLSEIFTTSVWSYTGVQRFSNHYRPLMTLGYLICYQFFGPLAYGFHLANVLLHTAIVCLLFKLSERMFRDRALAFGAAGLFALHPIHTESVAWVAAVTDLELTFFYLLTFWFFLGLGRPRGMGAGPEGRRWGLGEVAMVGSFILAMLSKEQALTLPLLATVYEHGYREDRGKTKWGEKLSRYGVLWLLAGAYLLFRIRFLGALAPVLQIAHLSGLQAILSAIALVGRYVGKLLWPVHLCAFYVFHKSESLADAGVMAGIGALMLCGALGVGLWRRGRLASFGLVWLLATLAPVLNARWMAANVFAERYLYLPSVGFCWVVAWGWAGIWGKACRGGAAWRRALAGGMSVLAALSVVRIVTRNQDWQNDIVLYTRTLAASPEALAIRNNLGVVYWNRGDVIAAEREWREVMNHAPNNETDLNYLGLLYTSQKRYADAVQSFRRALGLRPNSAGLHLNLGVAYAGMGLINEAELQFRAAVALAPLNIRARNELGKLYLEAGRLREAEEQFLRSVESEPNGEGYDNLGEIYRRWGDRERAEGAFQRAVLLDPYDSQARFNLGALYALRGQIAEAVREYQAGLETDPANLRARAALRELKFQTANAKNPEP